MYTADFHAQGSNYVITSRPMRVPNMQVKLDKLAQFVSNKGGSYRHHNKYHHKKHEWKECENGNAIAFHVVS